MYIIVCLCASSLFQRPGVGRANDDILDFYGLFGTAIEKGICKKVILCTVVSGYSRKKCVTAPCGGIV